MTHRRVRVFSEGRNGIGEDERQPVMARLAPPVKAFQFGHIGNAQGKKPSG